LISIIKIKNPADDAERIREQTWNRDLSGPTEKVESIIQNIRKRGDQALLEFAETYDNVKESIIVTKDEINNAYENTSSKQIKTIKYIKSKLEKSEKALLDKFSDIRIKSAGIDINKSLVPISRIGCYVPGGKARYPSTVIMCSVPAKVAGVRQIVAISPPMKNGKIDPLTLVAGDICGIDEFYKVGGAHGIAALAYGTETIKKVDKIVGPGGMYVSVAKSLVSKDTSIDMIAGPTELLIYANKKTNPQFVALDLISQAEHSEDTVCGVVTNSDTVARDIAEEIDKIIKYSDISRKEIVEKSLNKNGFIAICNDSEKAIEFINEFAPEHLEILDKNEKKIIGEVKNAGLILTGNYTPSSASDYCLGSNHVLPTYRFAKSRSSLSVLDFVKVINTIEINKNFLKKISPLLKEITEAEGLTNHYEAAHGRLR
jgi:histidinol dehydrogenase